MLYLIFLISGSAALIYQVLWARVLSLSFGVQAVSMTIVLASFMLGLALGAHVIRKYLLRTNAFLKIYALLEAAIGIYALLFPKISQAFDWTFEKILTENSPAWQSLTVRVFFAFCLLVPPTTFMGATLPLMSEHLRKKAGNSLWWHIGFLYAINTLGAVLGAAVSGFILLETIGIQSTLHLAALLNFLACGGAWHLARHTPKTLALPVMETPAVFQRRHIKILAVLGLSGGIALAAEIFWTRALEIVIGNSTYAFTTMLLAFLLGIALGSALISLWVKKIKNLTQAVVINFLLAAFWNILAIKIFQAQGAFFYSVSLQTLSPGQILLNYARSSMLLVPLAIFSGAFFPLALRLLAPQNVEASGEDVARASQWNTLGAVCGAFITGFCLVKYLDYLEGLYLLSLVYGISGGVFLLAFHNFGKDRFSLGNLALGVFAIGLMAYSSLPLTQSGLYAQRLERRFKNIEVVFQKPGLQGITTVLRPKGAAWAEHLLVNGRGMTRKISDTKMMAHLPLLAHANPQDMLIICFGMGTTFRSSSRYNVHLTAIELVPEVLEAFENFYADAPAIKQIPTAHVIAQDGRNYLKLTRQRFDVITVDPPPPIDGAGVGQLYSKEFVELARARLKPGGIFAHWIPFPGSRSGVDDPKMFELLLNTVASAFPYVATLPGYHHVGLHILASEKPLARDATWFAKRLRESPPAVIEDLREWDPVDIAYLSQLHATETLAVHSSATLTDNFPTLEFYLLRLMISGEKKEYPQVIW